jgi:hypothetical protein
MSIAIGSTSATLAVGAVNTVTTAGLSTSATGSIFGIIGVGGAGGSRSVSDSKGNTYSLSTNGGPLTNTNSGFSVYAYTCFNGTGGTAHTFTYNDNVDSAPGAWAFEIKGAALSAALDIDVGGGNIVGTPANSSITTLTANDLIISFCLDERTLDLPTINGGFTQLFNLTATKGVSFCAGYIAAPTASAYDPAYTVTATKTCAIWTGAFKQLSAGAGVILMGQACL